MVDVTVELKGFQDEGTLQVFDSKVKATGIFEKQETRIYLKTVFQTLTLLPSFIHLSESILQIWRSKPSLITYSCHL